MAKKLSKAKVKLPTPKASGVAGKVLTATAGYNAQIASQKRLLKSAKQEKAGAKKEETTWMSKLKKTISKKPNIAAYTEQQFAKWKIPEQYEKTLTLLEENESLRKDLVSMEEEEALRTQGAEQRLAPVTFIRGEQSLIQRQYEIKKNALAGKIAANAATAEAYQGNIELARGLVDDMVNATTYDYERKVQDITTFIQLNQTIIERAGTDVKYAMQNLLESSQYKLENAREEKKILGELMVQYPGANIKPTMTLDQAYSAARRASAAQAAEEQRRWEKEFGLSQYSAYKGSAGGGAGSSNLQLIGYDSKTGEYAYFNPDTGKVIHIKGKKGSAGQKAAASKAASSGLNIGKYISSTIKGVKQAGVKSTAKQFIPAYYQTLGKLGKWMSGATLVEKAAKGLKKYWK